MAKLTTIVEIDDQLWEKAKKLMRGELVVATAEPQGEIRQGFYLGETETNVHFILAENSVLYRISKVHAIIPQNNLTGKQHGIYTALRNAIFLIDNLPS